MSVSGDRWLYAWALCYAAVGAASLLVPLYALTLGATAFTVALVEVTVALAGVPGALLWGRLADRTGRRRVFVLVAIAGTAGGLGVMPLLDSVAAVLLANTVLWFLVAAAAPVLTLFVIEGVPERRWEDRIGRLNAYQRYGWVGGLAVGAVWTGVGSALVGELLAQQSFFLACALAAAASIPLARRWLPPEATTRPGRLTRRGGPLEQSLSAATRTVQALSYGPTRTLLALRSVRRGRLRERYDGPAGRYLLATLVFSGAFALFFGPVPAYLADAGYGSAAIFGLFILSNAASALAFLRVGSLTARVGPHTAQLGALGVRVALFPAIGLLGLAPAVPRLAGLAVGFVLVGVTWSVVATTAAGIVSRQALPDARGEALGLYTALAGLGGTVGGLAGGALAVVAGYLVAFTVAGVFVAVSILVVAASLPSEEGPTATAGEGATPGLSDPQD